MAGFLARKDIGYGRSMGPQQMNFKQHALFRFLFAFPFLAPLPLLLLSSRPAINDEHSP